MLRNFHLCFVINFWHLSCTIFDTNHGPCIRFCWEKDFYSINDEILKYFLLKTTIFVLFIQRRLLLSVLPAHLASKIIKDMKQDGRLLEVASGFREIYIDKHESCRYVLSPFLYNMTSTLNSNESNLMDAKWHHQLFHISILTVLSQNHLENPR